MLKNPTEVRVTPSATTAERVDQHVYLVDSAAKRDVLLELMRNPDVSRAIAKDLRQRGGNFVGPTIIYAFMQAVGMVNDHVTGCFRHADVAAIPHRHA